MFLPLLFGDYTFCSNVSIFFWVIIVCLFYKLLLFTHTADSISFLPPSVNKSFIALSRELSLKTEQEQFSFPFFLYKEKPDRVVKWLSYFLSVPFQLEQHRLLRTHIHELIQSMTFIRQRSGSIFEQSIWGRVIRHRCTAISSASPGRAGMQGGVGVGGWGDVACITSGVNFL